MIGGKRIALLLALIKFEKKYKGYQDTTIFRISNKQSRTASPWSETLSFPIKKLVSCKELNLCYKLKFSNLYIFAT